MQNKNGIKCNYWCGSKYNATKIWGTIYFYSQQTL